MNSDLAPIVKKVRDEQDANTILSMQETNYLEKRLGIGRPYVPIVYMLFLGNAMIYAQRYGYLQNRNFFLASVLLSYPLSAFLCNSLFGVKKLRDLAIEDYYTISSSSLYNKITTKKD